MSREYQIAGKKDSGRVRQFLPQHGQALLPMVASIEQGRLAVEELMGELGRVALGGQRVRPQEPRLRRRGGGEGAEVPIPAYAAMQSEEGLRQRLLSILLRGVSTRSYQDVVPEMAERWVPEAPFEEVDLLVIYIDGQDFGGHQVVSAVGVHTEGRKHVLGLAEGATENAVVVKGLLEDLVERGGETGECPS